MYLFSFGLLFLEVLLIQFVVSLYGFFIGESSLIIIDALPCTLYVGNSSLIHCIDIGLEHTSDGTTIKRSLVVHFWSSIFHYFLAKFVHSINELSSEGICWQEV